ncbi:MAG: hypothetical protein NVSMB3_09020 [Acidobacteriaceae bacterium]
MKLRRDFLRGGMGIAAIVLLAGVCPAQTGGGSGCAASPTDNADVVQTMKTMFAAAEKDDLAKFHSVAAASFYAYDGGKRFDGDALMNLLKAAHDAGKTYVWTVTEPEVHVNCDLAWVSYVNQGSLQDSKGTLKLTWLESAILRRERGGWRIEFLHSTRVPQ